MELQGKQVSIRLPESQMKFIEIDKERVGIAATAEYIRWALKSRENEVKK